MKRSRLSYDEWKCIISKDIHGKRLNSELLNGYIGLIDIKEVSKPQIWKFNGEDIVVCDKGRKWLSILLQNDWYSKTFKAHSEPRVVFNPSPKRSFASLCVHLRSDKSQSAAFICPQSRTTCLMLFSIVKRSKGQSAVEKFSGAEREPTA